MSGVWSLDGQALDVLQWERGTFGYEWWCAYGAPNADGWRPIYWIAHHGRDYSLSVMDSPDGPKGGEEVGTFKSLGVAQGAAEQLEGRST